MLERGVRAAKMFPRRHHYCFDDQVCGSIFSALEQSGIPLLIDVGLSATAPSTPRSATTTRPTSACATKPTWDVARDRAAFVKRRDNVYLDLTFTSVLHGVIEYFVHEGLEDRILFCTDAPMRDPIPQFGWVAFSRVPEGVRRRFLGGMRD